MKDYTRAPKYMGDDAPRVFPSYHKVREDVRKSCFPMHSDRDTYTDPAFEDALMAVLVDAVADGILEITFRYGMRYGDAVWACEKAASHLKDGAMNSRVPPNLPIKPRFETASPPVPSVPSRWTVQRRNAGNGDQKRRKARKRKR